MINLRRPWNRFRHTRQTSRQSFLDSLTAIQQLASQGGYIKIGQIFDILSGKGYATLLIIFSFPFCFPIQIPGFSTIFGITLGFLGLRMAFAKHLWWPEWILEKQLEAKHVESLAQKAIKGVLSLQKVLHPRWLALTKNAFLTRLHGVVVFCLSMLLALPLPIPLTNMLCAFPILFIGFGLLEDDGLVIVLGYVLAVVCFAAFTAIFLLGKAYFEHLVFAASS